MSAEQKIHQNIRQMLGTDEPALIQQVKPTRSTSNLLLWSLLLLAALYISYDIVTKFSHSEAPINSPTLKPDITDTKSAEFSADNFSLSSPPTAPIDTTVLDASGYVMARREATVSSVTTGRLSKVLVEEGNRVKKGQLLALLDDHAILKQIELAKSQLESSRLSLQQSQTELEAATDKLKRLQALSQQGYVSLNDLDDAKYRVSSLTASDAFAKNEIKVSQRRLDIYQQNLADSKIYAPFDGLIVDRAAEVGEIVSPISAGGGFTRTGIFTLVDTDSIEAHVKVNEGFISKVFIGQPAIITLRSYPDKKYYGHVSKIMAAAEIETASFKVVVEFDQLNKNILPNMSVDLSLLQRPETQISDANTSARSENL